MITITPVILAGGSGTRLWPLSRQSRPKQFLNLGLGGDSLLQCTLLRLGDGFDTPVVICHEDHRFLVAEQLRAIGKSAHIILEPIGRNTAPAIALAAFYLGDKNTKMLILSADHLMDDTPLLSAIEKAAALDALVAFGITPTHPHTGYGYIKKGAPKDDGYLIEHFVEKPDLATAQSYLDSGHYFWNAGLFMCHVQLYLDKLKQHAPSIYDACYLAIKNAQMDLDFIRIDKAAFESCPNISIDYAIMEQAQAMMVALDGAWSDIGAFDALWQLTPKDERNNALLGDVMTHHSHDNYVNTERLTALVGVNNLVVVDTKDALLIAHKDHTQDIKTITQKLHGRAELHTHAKVYRPWGHYEILAQGAGYQVKRIIVKAGQKLSVQMHHHRAEHWVVVSGTARVYLDHESFLLSKNESTYIRLGQVHALENPGKITLEIIEVQSGDYLGEDDIVRLNDVYGRA